MTYRAQDRSRLAEMMDSELLRLQPDSIEEVLQRMRPCLSAPEEAICPCETGVFDPPLCTDLCPDDRVDDIDGDGVCTGPGFRPPMIGGSDNCPKTWNPGQENKDGDQLGDSCDRCPTDTGNDC